MELYGLFYVRQQDSDLMKSYFTFVDQLDTVGELKAINKNIKTKTVWST